MPDIQPQPRILSIRDLADGSREVIDEQGTTILPPEATQTASGTFGVNVSWSGGTAEIRWSSDDDPGNNRSLVHVGLYAHTSGFTTYGNGWFNLRANGDGYSGWYTSIGSGWTHVAQRDVWVGHGANGALGMEVGVLNGEVQGTSFDNVWGTQWHNMSDYTVLPYAPQNVKVKANSVTTVSFGVEYTRNSHDHIDQDQAQWALDAGFSQVVWTDSGSAGYTDPSGSPTGPDLAPGTNHFVRIRSHTGAGWGPWSATVSQTTLPAVAPGLTVTALPAGTAAELVYTPPGGATGVSGYTWERRIPGGSEVISDDLVQTPEIVEGLTPGQVYEWRGAAWFGTYLSPWTGWIRVQQPNPDTSPGDFFDGDTADRPDIDYGWTGTPGSSTSTATGKKPVGWTQWTEGGQAGGLGTVSQTTGGAFLHDGTTAGTKAARVLFSKDTTAPTFEMGIRRQDPGRADVVPYGTYYGSIYVFPSRPQYMAAKLSFLKSDSNVALHVVGPAVLVPANQWTRLAAYGTAPSNGELAIVRAADVDGDDWSPWLAGDSLILDAAMISLGELFPYFDGATLDTLDTDYEWLGGEHASASAAYVLVNESGDPLEDPDCPRPPAPPRPPVVADDCIVEVGTWQRYWAEIPATVVTEWLTMVPTILLKIGASPARQVRVRIYPNPENVPPELFRGDWSSEQIVSYLPANSQMLIDGVDQRTWATVEGGERRRADHLLYGTGGTPATWPLLSCGIGYLASFDVPVDAPPGNLEMEIALTQRRS